MRRPAGQARAWDDEILKRNHRAFCDYRRADRFIVVPPSPTAYAICAQGELVELGITSQGGPYRACGPIRAVNHTSTYRQLR